MTEFDVVIVGGGPVGLALAGDLGWRGVRTLLVERSDGSITQPKMDGINVRTMEFCRRWGITDAIRNCGYPKDYPQDMVYLTSFNGYELGRKSSLPQAAAPKTGAPRTALNPGFAAHRTCSTRSCANSLSASPRFVSSTAHTLSDSMMMALKSP